MNYTLAGKKVVFTGGTSGLGRIALQYLIEQKAEVFVFYRNAALVDGFRNLSNVELIQCDLSSLSSVKNAIDLVKSKTDVLDILVNNAGLWEFGGFAQTEDELERTFQVNLLVPFILAESFLPLLKKADTPKIINTASALHQGTINFDDLQFAQKFSGFKAYRQSKLGIILLTRYWAQQFKNEITVVSQHPGLVATDLGRQAGWFSRGFFKLFGVSPKKGAQTLIHLIKEVPSKLIPGEYYAKSKVTKTTTSETYNLDTAAALYQELLKIAVSKNFLLR
jgi:NAD(P)-dependent dehydrogenase (short-subunit alcohol dehydrogenase family)